MAVTKTPAAKPSPVTKPKAEAPATVKLADVKKGEMIRISRAGLKGKIWGPRVLGAAPVVEGSEPITAGASGPYLALHPSWVKAPVYVPLAHVAVCQVKRSGRYLPVDLG